MPGMALVIEDDPSIARLVEYQLQQHFELEVQICHHENEGMLAITNQRFDLIIVDLILAEQKCGYDLIRQIRKRSMQVPIVILSVCDQESDVIDGLESGADDYITKPFRLEEFLARIAIVLRRAGYSSTAYVGRISTYTYDQIGSILLYPEKQEVILQGVTIPFRPKEFELLQYLIRHPGAIVSRLTLLEEVWGRLYSGGLRTVDVHMSTLRKKVGHVLQIEPIRGIGYTLVIPDD